MEENYQQGQIPGDPLGSNSQSYGILPFVDDVVGSLLFGNTDWSSNIMAELLGYNAQHREFAQQEYLLDKEQQWSSEQERMKRMKAAGINSNTAAAGIAGAASNPTAPTVSNATGAPAAGVSALGGAIGNIMQGAAANRQAGVAEQKMPSEIDKLNAEAATEWEKMGLTSAERQIAETNLKYADESAFRDLQIKRVNVHMVNQQYKNLKEQHDNIIAEYDEILARKDLAISQKEYYDTLEAKTNEEQKWLKIQREFWEENGYDLNANGVHNIIAQMVARGEDPEPFIEKYVDYIGRYQSALSESEQAAIDKFAYSIGYRRRHGENAADVVNGSVGGPVGFLNRVLNIGAGFLEGAASKIKGLFGDVKDSHDVKPVRDELSMVLRNAHIQLERDPNDKNAQEVIDLISPVLELTNKEMLEWFNRYWKD